MVKVAAISSVPQGLARASQGLRAHLWIAVTLATAIVLVLLAGGTELLLHRTWLTARRAAESSLERTAQGVENTVNRQLLQVDGALVSLPALFASIADAQGEIAADRADQLLHGFNFQAFAYRDLVLTRPDGTIWASARSHARNKPLPLSLGDLSSGQRNGSIALMGPVRDPQTGEWALFASRAMTLPGPGRLYATAEVPAHFIVGLLAGIGEQPGLHIMLEHKSGELLASIPHDELQIGKVQTPALVGLRPDGIAFEVPRNLVANPTLAVVRTTLYNDLAIVATLEEDLVLADWARDRNRVLIGVTLAALLLMTVAIALCAALRQHERVEAERGRARTVLENAVDAMSDGFVMWDRDDRLVTCNKRYRELYARIAPYMNPGAAFEDVIRRGIEHGQYPEAQGADEAFVRETVAWHRETEGALERRLPDGKWLLVRDRRTIDGGIVGTRTDITILKHAESDLAAANARARDAMAEVEQRNLILREQDEALQTQNRLFDAALNNMSHGLIMADAGQRLIVCNHRFLELFGLDAADAAAGIDMAALFEAVTRRHGDSAPAVAAIWRSQRALAEEHRGDRFVASALDDLVLAVVQQPMQDGGWVATYEDVTKQQRAESRIRFLAHHDELTTLPNRILFRSEIDGRLRALCVGGSRLALLYLDLDKFKDVNDTLGHPIGDALLQAVARRLRECLGEQHLAARLGGDEFAVACFGPDMPEAAERLAAAIIDALSPAYHVHGHTVVVGVSIGVAVAHGPDADADTLLKQADMALYQAKANGRGISCCFEPPMETRLRARLDIEADLRHAVEHEQFEVAYQPIVNTQSGRICGFEALLRWPHPLRGMISPAVFIPLAEETDLIRQVGAWVLHRACRDIARLPGGIKVAVNLSPLQLRSDEIVQIVGEALAASGLDPTCLELEITESALLESNDRTVALLNALRALGPRIVLDDFGTGYSSLSHLRAFPLNKIKIDQSFIREMTTNLDCSAIVRSVIGLADDLGMRTTAEGVETAAQLRMVRVMGCSEAQGFYLGQPKSILHAAEILASFRLPDEGSRLRSA